MPVRTPDSGGSLLQLCRGRGRGREGGEENTKREKISEGLRLKGKGRR